MKLLIVTAWYAPFIHPRAHRWSVLAAHWAAQGHEIQVVTARHRGYPATMDMHGVQVHRAGFDSLKEVFYYYTRSNQARGRVGVAAAQPGLFLRFFHWAYRTFWKTIYFPDDAGLWYFPARRKIFQLLDTQDFDAVISVSLPFTGHLLGLAVKRRFPGLYWLADIGDPFSIQPVPPNNPFLYGKKSRQLEKTVLTTADAVTVTTEYTREKYAQFFGSETVQKMWVVPPLFAPQPEPLDLPQAKQNNGDTIKIGYFGALYSPTRMPDAFLQLLEQTFIGRPDLRQRLEVHFYGEIFPEFFARLQAAPNVYLHGLCTRAEVLHAVRTMDVLLNIGNTTDFQLPSKAVEYLASGKPVLNLVYVENDPFTAFFGKNEVVFNLSVRNGMVEDAALRAWIVWLESAKTTPSEEEREARIAPFTVGKIAENYLSVIKCGTD